MKKGFTLIELLAVIVILAIISFIAVPVVLNIIQDSKIESVKASAISYTKGAVTKITSQSLKKSANPSSCKIVNNNLDCYNPSTDSYINIDMDTYGNKFIGGHVEFKDRAITNYTLCTEDGYSVNIDGDVDTNSTYCKNISNPNADTYIAKFYVNNTEFITNNNFDTRTNEYKRFVEGSNELVMPDVPLDKSILDSYSMPVEYVWLTGVYGNLYEPGESYKFINDNVNFYSAIYFARPNSYAWNNRYWATYSNKKNIKGSNVYSGVKTRFHLAPGTDDFAYHTAPFLDGTTYTFEELNTTYKNTEFALMSFYSGVDLDKVIGTEIKVFVGDYQNPTRVLADEYYDIDPNSNDDFIISAVDNATGALNTPKTIIEAFPNDPYKETYDAARVIRLIIPYEDYKDLTIKYVVTYKDINGGSYIWMSYSDTSLSE